MTSNQQPANLFTILSRILQRIPTIPRQLRQVGHAVNDLLENGSHDGVEMDKEQPESFR